MIKSLFEWLFSRFVQIMLVEDEALNVVAFDGSSNMTVSRHCANAMVQKKLWGCIACKILSVLIQKNHCQNVLKNIKTSTFGYIRAAIFISFAFFLILKGLSLIIAAL